MRGDERELDARIDAALRSYAEPAEVPEARIAVARILERAREAETARPLGWKWRLAVPVSACVVALLVAAVVWIALRPQPARIAWVPEAPKVVNEAAVPSAGSAAPEANVADNAQSRGPARAVGARSVAAAAVRGGGGNNGGIRELPKLAVFPTPKPLSPEEAALVKFSARSSPEVKAAVVQAAKQPEDLTTVAALKMRPFNPGEDQESANDKEELP